MSRIESIPLLVNVDDFFKAIKAYNSLKAEKFLDIRLSESEITQIKVPKYLLKLSQDFKIPLPELINCVLRDFVIKFNYGEGKLKKSMWKKFQKLKTLTPEQKTEVFKALWSNK